MRSKIIDVNKCYWAAHTQEKEKADRGNDFNDCCLIPITNICRVLVLNSTNFTALLYLCFSKPFIHQTFTGANTGPSSRHQRYCADISTIVPTSCWRFLVLYCLSPASSVSAYIIEIYLRGQQTERVD